MKEEYKNWTITYVEDKMDNNFIAHKVDLTLSSNSLKDLKKKIDKYQKKKFERIPFLSKGGLGCWYNSDRNHFYKGEITSVAEERVYGDIESVWVSIEDEKGKKHRSKETLNFISLYKQTEHNQAIIDKIHNINRQIEKLEEKREETVKSLEKFTVSEIKELIE